MNLAEVRDLVRRMRRQFAVAAVVRIASIVFILFAGVAALSSIGLGLTLDAWWGVVILVAILWALMTILSVRQLRTTTQASVYFAAGRLDLAESQLKRAVRLFTLSNSGRLLACHNLAVIAHGRKDFDVAAELCGAVLAAETASPAGLRRICRILLADCRLLLGDARSADRALEPLSVRDPTLRLPDQLVLLPVELRCQVATGDYAAAVSDLRWKLSRAELLEAPKAALVHGLLAKACRTVGKDSEADFLLQRAALYHDLDDVAAEYPIVLDSAGSHQTADNN